ncbi:hypothetical protein AVM02_14800 [Brucella anthropi]|uniref:hypothetical protein n=1 Tax=Brucella anthropi TaxID=529 RepID=UPI0039873B57
MKAFAQGLYFSRQIVGSRPPFCALRGFCSRRKDTCRTLVLGDGSSHTRKIGLFAVEKRLGDDVLFPELRLLERRA